MSVAKRLSIKAAEYLENICSRLADGKMNKIHEDFISAAGRAGYPKRIHGDLKSQGEQPFTMWFLSHSDADYFDVVVLNRIQPEPLHPKNYILNRDYVYMKLDPAIKPSTVSIMSAEAIKEAFERSVQEAQSVFSTGKLQLPNKTK